ncbi:sporozoite surface protein 2-like [Bicyclus anynana]|uniref:Sporozoite surface protein 2-like n=1 Tax=Bicyclus anynana TaxID=110368 RepID=A0A6J1NS77_BICAN|nr:sporozoite surface protein 2-like [Bicyclus anynana]
MKFLLLLAFVATVSALPRLEQTSPANDAPLEPWGPSERSGDGDIPSENGSGPSSPQPPEIPEESDEDEDDSDEKINIGDLINALSGIRETLHQKIHDRLSQPKNEDSDPEDDNNVPSERVPADEDNSNDTTADAPLPGNGTEGPNSPPSNNTDSGNNTVSNQRPNINFTAIKNEIHEKIENILLNILRPLLGNNSEPENGTAVNPPQPGNNTEAPSNETGPGDNGRGPQGVGPSNNSAIAPPKPGNNTEAPSNETGPGDNGRGPQSVGPSNNSAIAPPKPGNNTEAPSNETGPGDNGRGPQSVGPSNNSAIAPHQPGNNTEAPSNETGPGDNGRGPQVVGPSNNSAIAPPQPGNNSLPPPEVDASNSGNETDEAEIIANEPATVGSGPSSGSEVIRGFQPINVEPALQSQVRFANTYPVRVPLPGLPQPDPTVPHRHRY